MDSAAKKRALESKRRIAAFKKADKCGKYAINNGYILLSEEEVMNQTFSAEKLANTLGILIEDANLLHSSGKTYVFAKSIDGNTYELYHPSLYINHISIHVEAVTEAYMNQFNHDEWSNSPYSSEVGQTNNKNHFVC